MARYRQAHHPERNSRPSDAREEWNEQRDLKRPGPRLRIDAEDLLLGRLRLTGKHSCSWVLLMTSASSSSASATCCCSAGESTVLSSAMLVKGTRASPA